MLSAKRKSKTNVVLKQSVAFWSPFSNGSTTCAIEYAKALSELYDSTVALVELDMLHPTFDSYFPESNKGFNEILKSDRLDRITFENIRNSAIQGEFDVYKNYFNYVDLANINMSTMEKVLIMIMAMYDFVIFDTNRNFDNKLTDLALRMADRVFIPFKPSVLEIKLINQYLEVFEDHQEWSILKCAAIINQYSPNHPTYVEIESSLNTSVLGYVQQAKPSQINKIMHKELLKIAEREVKK